MDKNKKFITIIIFLLIISVLISITLIVKMNNGTLDFFAKSTNYKFRISGSFFISEIGNEENIDLIYKDYDDFSNEFYNTIEKNAKDILKVSNIKERITIKSNDDRNQRYIVQILGNEQEELIEIGKNIQEILLTKNPIKSNYQIKFIDGMSSYSSITKVLD